VTTQRRTRDRALAPACQSGVIPDGAIDRGARPSSKPGKTLRYTSRLNLRGRVGTTRTHGHGQFGARRLHRAIRFLLVRVKSLRRTPITKVNLAVHHWEPSLFRWSRPCARSRPNIPQTSGSDVGYKYATSTRTCLVRGEPIRVKKGDRVLLRLLNASATENVVLALPGHKFHVIAMDGNPVPNPSSVEVLSLRVAERVDAIVEMNSPGVWITRLHYRCGAREGPGRGDRVCEHTGEPVWRDPAPAEWTYTQFAASQPCAEPARHFRSHLREPVRSMVRSFDTVDQSTATRGPRSSP